MERDQAGLIEWSTQRADEFIRAANQNLLEGRLYAAAEEIFRATEASLELMVYKTGVTRIVYPGKEKDFSGRLALQLLMKEHLIRAGLLPLVDYRAYEDMAQVIHYGGYSYSASFSRGQLERYLEFAESLFTRAKSMKTSKCDPK